MSRAALLRRRLHISAPVNTVAPVLTLVGATTDTYECSTGTWVAIPDEITYEYQWQRDGVDITDEDANQYSLDVADEGTTITCIVTATNAVGSNDATSNELEVAEAGDYPTVMSTTVTTKATPGTSHSVNLPGTINADDYLVAVCSFNHSGVTIGSSGWTLAHSFNIFSNLAVRVYLKQAIGNEDSGTISFTTPTACTSGAVVHRISGVYDSIEEDVAWSCSTGTTTQFGENPDPDAVTAGWGQDLNLALACYLAGNTGATLSSPPSGYTSGSASGATGLGTVGTAYAEVNDDVADPGTFTIDDGGPGENWHAFTLIFRPGTPVSLPVPDEIEIVGTSETVYSLTGATTRNITLPSGIQANDLICIYSTTQDSSSPGAPTAPGFTQRWSLGHSSSFRPLVTCLYKIAAGTESGTTVTLTWGTSLDNALVCVVFRGVDPTNPFDVTQSSPTTGGNNPDPASITPVTDGAWVLVVCGANRAGAMPAITSISTGYTETFSQVPDERGLVIIHKELATAAADNPSAWVWSTVDNHTTITDALRPNATGGEDPPPEPEGEAEEPTIPTFASTVTITTAQNIKTIIEAAAAGTHFTIASGTHTTANGVLVKSNMHIRLATGAILDGSSLGYAFRPADQNVTGVSIGGDPASTRPIIRDYGNGTTNQSFGAIMGMTDDRLAGQFIYRDVEDWFIYHLDFEENSSNGVMMGSNWTMYDCEFHGHTTTGLGGDRIVGGLVYGCEFYWNALNPSTGVGSNGANAKFTWINADPGRTSITPVDRTKSRFIISHCIFEATDRGAGTGTCARGVWFDLDCQNCLVEYCTFDDHPNFSCFAEGSNNIEFAHNTVNNSDGFGPTFNGNFSNAAICFGESTNCWAHHNVLNGCDYALMNRMSNRTSDWYTATNNGVNYSWAAGPRYWILNTTTIPTPTGQSNMWTGNNKFEFNDLNTCNRVVINEGTNGGGMTTQGSTNVATIIFANNDYTGSPGILFYDRSTTSMSLSAWQALGRQ